MKTLNIFGKEFNRRPQETGFSLLELFVVISILGILTTLAVPKYQMHLARAKQMEAKSSLLHIFTLMELFAIDHHNSYIGAVLDQSGDPNWVGFSNKLASKYLYSFAKPPADQEFVVDALAKNVLCDGTTDYDKWTLDQDMNLVNSEDGLADCR